MIRWKPLVVATLASALLGSMAVAASPTDRPAVAASGKPAAIPNGHLLDHADLEAWLDGVVPYALQTGDMAGAVIVVVKDGSVLLQKGYGYADVDQRTPMDPAKTMIRIGSTSKLFTWIAVMQLVEQGKLDLGRDVNDYLDFKIPRDFGKPVTLRDLMNHRGGFEEGLKDVLRTDPHAVPSTQEYLKEHPRPMLFAPGEVPAYSNYGASVAGYIVERVSGVPFERYIDANILVPLGMAHSSFDQPLQDRFTPAVSKGYRTASEPPGPYEQIVTRPAGSGTTTAADMAHFMLANLQQGRFENAHILRPETMEQMHNPSQDAAPGFATMAHGFFRETHNGHLIVGHGGDTIFFHNEMNLLPQDGVGILINFNSRGRDDAVYVARSALFDAFMDRYFPDATAPTATAPLASAVADAQQIAGTYESSRRIEHGFLSFFYLLEQAKITANGDGTISAPGFATPSPEVFREIAPQVWQQVRGSRRLELRTIGGVKSVIDGSDPTSILQAVPLRRSAALNLTILLTAGSVLMVTLLCWLASPWLKARKSIGAEADRETRRAWLIIRCAVAFQAIYLIAWLMLLRPLLSVELQFYSTAIDGRIRALQVSGLLAILCAGVGIWGAWRLARIDVTRRSKVAACLIAASMVGVVWIAFMGGFLSFSLNY